MQLVQDIGQMARVLVFDRDFVEFFLSRSLALGIGNRFGYGRSPREIKRLIKKRNYPFSIHRFAQGIAMPKGTGDEPTKRLSETH
jgi:hypothetical protein